MRTFLQQRWPVLLLIVILLLIVRLFHNDLASPSAARAWVVFILAAGVLYGSAKKFFPKDATRNDPQSVRFVIAFDAVVFIVVGLSATVLACSRWEAALLVSGACLLIGGFFGLLFGYPQGVAQQSKQIQGEQANPQGPSRDKTLLADSAATLGKVITGFTLAKLSGVSTSYWNLCKAVGPVLGVQDAAAAQVHAGVIVAYFLATGFLSGLLLPSYFMSDRF